MPSKASDDLFKDSLRRTLDLAQLLKYNLGDFKELQIHKELTQKTMRKDTADLMRAIDAWLFKMRNNCSAETWGVLSRVMQRDKLHDISLHLDVVYRIENLDHITGALKQEVEIAEVAKKNNEGGAF